MAKRGIIKTHGVRNIVAFLISCLIFFSGMTVIWFSTFKVPSADTIEYRKISQSTKIYDQTGKVLLYDVYQNAKRTVVPFEDISQYIKDAAISIEDKTFYSHKGVRPLSILRALLVDVLTLDFTQGGSTITQQVVKKSILVDDKTPIRKLKELVLALKLEKLLTKDQILSMYLNENPYGGTIYGVEEASQAFFGKPALEVTLAEAAYLAALPQAPTRYSPYGKHFDELEDRKNLVLKEMFNDGKISQEQYSKAIEKKVVFLPKSEKGIKAPHFVMYVVEYLKNRYGEDVLEQGGLRVKTTLRYDWQEKAEKIAKEYALQNKQNFNGENAAFVVIDPKTGYILTMVGSRDYFDQEIDGNFNVVLAHRQPGSTFKPFAYAEAFKKGYTPETVLFDLPTQFSVKCPIESRESGGDCYAPVNYDDKFRGPLTMRESLAQSVNVTSVKTLYLAGVTETIKLATDMGIHSLSDPNIYGLTLVLGGGEVSLLDMSSAYGVFATEGVRNQPVPIIEVLDKNGRSIEMARISPTKVLDEEVARKISDILSDNVARAPLYGPNSAIYFPNRDIAVKTGTTNDYRDAWIIGYTPNLVIGTWAGNNNNTPMEKKVSGLIVAPMWRVFLNEIIDFVPNESFVKPQKEDSYELKPVLRGKWQGGISQIVQGSYDPNIPYNSINEILSGGVHSILYWVDKDNPRELIPIDPNIDSQFIRWEYSVRLWSSQNGYQ